MKRNLNIISRSLFFGVALVATSQLFTGCAHTHSNAATTVRDAEKLVAQYPAAKKATPHGAEVAAAPGEGPGFAMMPPAPGLGPTRPPVDTYRKHLFELYGGQQQIIESLEANDEGPAMDLPPDISNEELVNILQKQQKLIKALHKKLKAEGRRRSAGQLSVIGYLETRSAKREERRAKCEKYCAVERSKVKLRAWA